MPLPIADSAVGLAGYLTFKKANQDNLTRDIPVEEI